MVSGTLHLNVQIHRLHSLDSLALSTAKDLLQNTHSTDETQQTVWGVLFVEVKIGFSQKLKPPEGL